MGVAVDLDPVLGQRVADRLAPPERSPVSHHELDYNRSRSADSSPTIPIQWPVQICHGCGTWGGNTVRDHEGSFVDSRSDPV